MPWTNQPTVHVTPVMLRDAVLLTGHDPADFQAAATDGYRVGVLRIDPVATADGTPFNFGMLEAGSEWDIGPFDDLFSIGGASPLIELGGEPALVIDSTVLPFEDEYYLIAVVNWVSSAAENTVDWLIVYRSKETIDVYDTASLAVNQPLLEKALALAGHNIKMRAQTLSAGQPSSYELAMFNPGITDMSVDPDTLDSNSGLASSIDVSITIDDHGDIQRVEGE